MDSIDLRSDTVTWPTPEMREAMAEAPVGDDVWGDDPTVKRLEVLAADHLGKEAALFVASGTMGNLIAILTHCNRGDEIIMGYQAHTFQHEGGGAAALGGVHTHTIPVQPDGTLALEDIRRAIRDVDDVHYPRTRMVEVENTQGDTGGLPIAPEYIQSVKALCDEHNLKLHMDGARVFNAATALNLDVREITAPVDSVMFCLSKGLCAPVGSMLCGSEAFINQARRIRKTLGGGMRQAGILAAAGIIAIEDMTGRLAIDHDNAHRLAEGLSQIDGIHIDLNRVRTNMVFLEMDESLPVDAQTLCHIMETQHNIKLGMTGPYGFRLVTHYWIKDQDIDVVVEAFRAVLEAA